MESGPGRRNITLTGDTREEEMCEEVQELYWRTILQVPKGTAKAMLRAETGSMKMKQRIWKQKLMLSWMAPRGIVTAAVASLFAIRLEAAGFSGAGRLQGLVFLTILMTVGLQGLTAPLLARRLGLVQPELETEAGSADGAADAPAVLPGSVQ